MVAAFRKWWWRVLTVTEKASDASLVPFTSVSVAVKVCVPFLALVSVKPQLPDGSTADVPRLVMPS